MIVPPAPIVPSNQYRGGILGVVTPVVALMATVGPAIADRVDNRRYPRGAPAGRVPGMIGIVSSGNYPTDLAQLAAADIGEHIGGFKVDIVMPQRAGTGLSLGSTDMADRVGRGPNTVCSGTVVFPADAFVIQQVAHRLMFKTGEHDVGRILDAESIDQLNRGTGIGSASRFVPAAQRVR